ncbi:MAG TPA: hypothetical protein VI197_02315 [Polyangiaceae bacterium]
MSNERLSRLSTLSLRWGGTARVEHVLLLLLAMCQPACQAQPPPTTPARTVAAADVGSSDDPKTRIFAALAKVPRGEPVLGALSAQQRARFDQLLGSLSEAELSELRAPASELAQTRPLLHLMAGGRSPTALSTLATTTAGADELVHVVASPTEFAEVLATLNEVIPRAAREWARYAESELRAGPVDVAFCETLDQVGATLGDVALRYEARRLWLSLEESPAARLNLARAAMWNGDWQAAREHYERALRAPEQSPQLQQFAEQIRHLLDAGAELDRAPGNADEATAQARVHLALHHPRAAAALLEARAEEAPSHLGLATVRLLAAFPDVPCAGVVGGLGNAALCAFAQRQGMFESPLFADLKRAWVSKKGRTVRSVQDFLGLAVVLPWRARLLLDAPAPDPAPAAELRALSEEVIGLSPDFAGLTLFARALEAAFEAARATPSGQMPRVSPAAADALTRGAEELAAGGSLTDMRAAAALGITALLSQHRDVRPLYSLLPSGTPAPSQVALGTWLAAAWRDAPLFERMKSDAIDLLERAPESAPMNGTLVPLLAEAANLVEANDDNVRTLDQLASGLLQPGIPPALRLRAGLHRAHRLETNGQGAEAAALLAELVDNSAVAAAADHSVLLLRVLMQARLVLQASPQSEPQQVRDRFREVFDEQALPPGIIAWQRLWDAELEARASLRACGRDVACKRRAEATRKAAQAEVRASLPPVTAALAERGVLTLGALELTIDYHPGRGLVAVVRTDPALISLPWPKP